MVFQVETLSVNYLPISVSIAWTCTTSDPTVAFSCTRNVKLLGGLIKPGALSLKSCVRKRITFQLNILNFPFDVYFIYIYITRLT